MGPMYGLIPPMLTHGMEQCCLNAFLLSKVVGIGYLIIDTVYCIYYAVTTALHFLSFYLIYDNYESDTNGQRSQHDFIRTVNQSWSAAMGFFFYTKDTILTLNESFYKVSDIHAEKGNGMRQKGLIELRQVFPFKESDSDS